SGIVLRCLTRLRTPSTLVIAAAFAAPPVLAAHATSLPKNSPPHALAGSAASQRGSTKRRSTSCTAARSRTASSTPARCRPVPPCASPTGRGAPSSSAGSPPAGGPPPESQGAGASAPPEVTIHLTQPGAGTGPVAPGRAAADAPSIHPTAIIEPGVTIGARSAIREGVHVCGPSVIGRDCVLGEQTYVAHDVTIGDGVKTNGRVYVCTADMIEDLVMISVVLIFSNKQYPRSY